MIQDSSSNKAMIFFEIPAGGREVSILILHGRKLNSKGQLNDERQLNNKGQLNCKGQLIKKSNDVFLKIRAEGREFSIFILVVRKLSSKGQLNNKRQLNNKGQRNNTGQLIKQSNDMFLKSRPKAGKLA